MSLNEIRSILHGYYDSNDLIHVSNLIISIPEEAHRNLAIRYVKGNVANKATKIKPIDVNVVAAQSLETRSTLEAIGVPMKLNVGILCTNRQIFNAWTLIHFLLKHHASEDVKASMVSHDSPDDSDIIFDKDIATSSDGVFVQKIGAVRAKETDLHVTLCMPMTTIPFPYIPHYPTLWLNSDVLIILEEKDHTSTPRLVSRKEMDLYGFSHLLPPKGYAHSPSETTWKCKYIYLCNFKAGEKSDADPSMLQSFQDILHSLLNELFNNNNNITTQ